MTKPTRKERQEAAEKKREALHLELVIVMQDKYRACLDHGEPAKDALHKACAAVDSLAESKVKACPQEKMMILEVWRGIANSLCEKLQAAAKKKEK